MLTSFNHLPTQLLPSSSKHTTHIILLLSCLSWIIPTVHAKLSCHSPSGSYTVGDTVVLQMTDDGAYPRIGDIYSMSASIRCSSSLAQLLELSSIMNGQAWTIPTDILTSCQGNQIFVEYSGTQWDKIHLLHVTKYKENCRDMVLTVPPQPTSDPTSTIIPSVTVSIDPSGTPITISNTNIATPPVLPPSHSGSQVSINPAIPTSSKSSTSPTPPTSTLPGPGQHGSVSTVNTPNSNIPAAALGTIAGVVVVALIIFGMIRNRKRKMKKRMSTSEKLGRSGFGGADGSMMPMVRSGRVRSGESGESWDYGGYTPNGSVMNMGFVPLQHQEMRDYSMHLSLQPSLQPSLHRPSLHRSGTNMTVLPELGYSGATDGFAYSYVEGQGFGQGYVEGFSNERAPEGYPYPPAIATSQPSDLEYRHRLRGPESAEIPPLPSFSTAPTLDINDEVRDVYESPLNEGYIFSSPSLPKALVDPPHEPDLYVGDSARDGIRL